MDIESQMAFRNVMRIFLRDNDALHAGLAGPVGFFKDAADGFDLTLDRDFPGEGHVLTDGHAGYG